MVNNFDIHQLFKSILKFFFDEISFLNAFFVINA